MQDGCFYPNLHSLKLPILSWEIKERSFKLIKMERRSFKKEEQDEDRFRQRRIRQWEIERKWSYETGEDLYNRGTQRKRADKCCSEQRNQRQLQLHHIQVGRGVTQLWSCWFLKSAHKQKQSGRTQAVCVAASWIPRPWHPPELHQVLLWILWQRLCGSNNSKVHTTTSVSISVKRKEAYLIVGM